MDNLVRNCHEIVQRDRRRRIGNAGGLEIAYPMRLCIVVGSLAAPTMEVLGPIQREMLETSTQKKWQHCQYTYNHNIDTPRNTCVSTGAVVKSARENEAGH